MTYHTRTDIPYHDALADAFTICDAYHCSVLGPTDPYALHAYGQIEASGGRFRIDFGNTGGATAVFHVRSGSDAHIPRTYTVEPQKSLSDTWNLGLTGVGECDLSVHGPNGFFRAFKGTVPALARALDVRAAYDEKGGDITLVIANRSAQSAKVFILDKYKGKRLDMLIGPNASVWLGAQ